jgi:hypothetical protein
MKLTLQEVTPTSAPDCDTIHGLLGDMEITIHRVKMSWAVALRISLNGVVFHEEVNPSDDIKGQFNDLYSRARAVRDAEIAKIREDSAHVGPMLFK